ncbi:MAG: pyridoxamine 5-phosphate oxidase [Paracoccus sp. (in: a-proteobacteria)]
MVQDFIQQTDDRTRQLTRDLLRQIHHAVLSVIDEAHGYPYLARIACQADEDGIPLAFLSEIAVHTRLLESQPKAALLIEAPPGRGEAMAQARLSLQVVARRLPDHGPAHAARLASWLAHNPKSRAYAELPGFHFWRLEPHAGLLNAGFGQAYRIGPGDIRTPPADHVRGR